MAIKGTERAQVLGSRIRQARDESNHNNSSLAAATGLPRRTIVRLAGGQNEPDLETIERIANATRKPLSFFQIERPRPDLSAAVESLVDVLIDEVRTKLMVRTTDLAEAAER